MNRSVVILVGVIALAALSIYGSLHFARVSHSQVAAAGRGDNSPLERAPDFELQTLDGRTVKLSDFRGKLVVLNFWATWCAPCRVEMPWLIDFQRPYKEQGLEVVGVSMDDGEQQQVADFVKEMKVNYTVLKGNHEVGDEYGGVRFLPQTFIVGRDSKIIKHIFGIQSKSDFADAIKQALSTQTGWCISESLDTIIRSCCLA